MNPSPAHASRARRAFSVLTACLVAAVIGTGAALTLASNHTPDAPGTNAPNAPQASGGPLAGPSVLPSQPAPAMPDPTVSFTLVAAGDVLPHQPVLASAAKGKGYDFTKQFAPTSAMISGADIAICHMETPVAPPGTKPSGYPMFGAPASLVRDLGKAGWDGCSTASNHTVDRGFDGLKATLDAFQDAGMGYAGSARTEQESTHVQFYNVVEGGRTVKVAHISYTYGLNGLPVPSGKPWSVNVLNADGADVTPIVDAAANARDHGADVVIASVHCCVEYVTQPNQAQVSIATQIAKSGLVDLYIGHHAHVPQPIEKLPGGPNGAGMWVAYGLGNFISNQDASTVGHAETANGLVLRATFTVPPDDHVSVDVGWSAVTVDRTHGHVVYPITKNTGAVGGLSASQVKSRWQLVADAAGPQAPEITDDEQHLADFVWITPRLP